MLDTELFRNLLKLPEPWLVEEVRVDKPSNRIDIRIGFARRKATFFAKQASCPRCHRPLPESTGNQRTLRHLNFGEMRAYLSIPVFKTDSINQNDCGCRRAWSNPGSRFSVEMERLIIEGLHLLRSIEAVSKLYSVNAADVREVNAQHHIVGADKPVTAQAPAAIAYAKAHFDDGGLEVAYIDEDEDTQPHGQQSAHVTPPAPVQPPAPEPAAAPVRSGIPSEVPAESDPLWQRLIENPSAARIETLGLKMLLEQVRLSLANNPSPSARLAGARILRLYFIKHWRQSKPELEQLLAQFRAAAAAPKPAQAEVAIPLENDPGWQYLIAGRVPIQPDAVALKMLIERLRLTLGPRPTVASRLAGARILREFFLKHHARHRNELLQLITAGRNHMQHAAAPPPKAEPVTADIPADTARCWQLLIDGNLDIHTSAVGLTMLLERVRLTIGGTPSPAARLAAARVLRQYFEKYKPRLEAELRILSAEEVLIHSGTASGGQVVEFVEVPPETHPSWDKLIRGELQIRTEALGLKMLLERVRLSLGTDPTESLRLAAARVLRQYFIKHRSRHRAELEQLKAA